MILKIIKNIKLIANIKKTKIRINKNNKFDKNKTNIKILIKKNIK